MWQHRDEILARLRAEAGQFASLQPYLQQAAALDFAAMVAAVCNDLLEGLAMVAEEAEGGEAPLIGVLLQCGRDMVCREGYWGAGEDDEYFECGPCRSGFADPGTGAIMNAALDALEADDSEANRKAGNAMYEYMWHLLAKVLTAALAEVVTDARFLALPLHRPFRVYLCEHDGWGCNMDEEALVYQLD